MYTPCSPFSPPFTPFSPLLPPPSVGQHRISIHVRSHFGSAGLDQVHIAHSKCSVSQWCGGSCCCWEFVLGLGNLGTSTSVWASCCCCNCFFQHRHQRRHVNRRRSLCQGRDCCADFGTDAARSARDCCADFSTDASTGHRWLCLQLGRGHAKALPRSPRFRY